MLKFLFLFLSCLLTSFHLHAQDIEEQTFLRVEDLRSKLGLSVVDAQKTEEILNEYNFQVIKLIEEGTEDEASVEESLEKLRAERKKELSSIFTDDQMVLFDVIIKRQVEGVKDYYASLVEKLSTQPEFTKDLTDFHERNKTPVYLKHKQLLNKQLTKKDSVELIQLGIQFNEILIVALEQSHLEDRSFSDAKIKKMVKSTSEVDPAFKHVWKRINKLYKKYDSLIDKEFMTIDTYTTQWNEGIKTILQKYIPAEEKESLDQMFYVLTQYGISKKLSQLAFLLFDVRDIHAFYQMQANAQELFLKKTL